MDERVTSLGLVLIVAACFFYIGFSIGEQSRDVDYCKDYFTERLKQSDTNRISLLWNDKIYTMFETEGECLDNHLVYQCNDSLIPNYKELKFANGEKHDVDD